MLDLGETLKVTESESPHSDETRVSIYLFADRHTDALQRSLMVSIPSTSCSHYLYACSQ